MNLIKLWWSNRASSVKKYGRSYLVAAFVAGLIAGIWANSSLTDTPKMVHTVTPGPTVTVETTKEVVVPVMPVECQAAVGIILKLQADLNTVTDAGGRQNDILKAAKIAIITKDPAALNAAGSKQNELNNSVTDARQHISQAMTDLQKLITTCSNKLQG
jgi:hypothetical protein